MYSWSDRLFQRLPATIDISGQRARETGNGGAAHLGRYEFHCVEVPFGCNRKARLDNIDLKPLELARHVQFLFHVHAETGSLLSISQCRVENYDSVHFIS